MQLAIQGKLVEQHSEEGTAEELYQQIQVERNRLLKEGKIKKGKPLPRIAGDEIPFDIPESWKWVRLGELIQVVGGVSYKKGDVTKKGYRILRGGNIQDMQVLLKEDDIFLPHLYEDPGKSVQKGDIIVVASTGSKKIIGKAGYVDKEMPRTMVGAFLRICRPHSSAVKEYLRCIFESNFYRKHIRDLSQGTNINNVKEAYITEFAIPLPPFAEQKRIVAKIEELLPYIDCYEQAWNELEELNRKFPDDLQKSILQLAIQGKLVEQRPEEGTAEELYQQIQKEKQRLVKEGKIKKGKLLPELAEDEVAFDIPESWKWVRVGNIFSLQAGKNITAVDICEATSSEHPFVCYGGNGIRGYVASSNRSGHYALIGRQGALCGNINFAKGEFYATEHAVVVDHYQVCDALWSGYFFRALNLNQYATATAQPGLAVNTIVKLPIPLPPLAEQKRVVARIEELLPLCEKMKSVVQTIKSNTKNAR